VVIRAGEPVVGRELLTDPAFTGSANAKLREDAVQKGYRATAEFPLESEESWWGP
jgi:hypothetical protein